MTSRAGSFCELVGRGAVGNCSSGRGSFLHAPSSRGMGAALVAQLGRIRMARGLRSSAISYIRRTHAGFFAAAKPVYLAPRVFFAINTPQCWRFCTLRGVSRGPLSDCAGRYSE